MILQLNPAITLYTPRGEGRAVLVIDYGPDDDLLWVVFLKSSRACFAFRNSEVRAVENLSLGWEKMNEEELWPSATRN